MTSARAAPRPVVVVLFRHGDAAPAIVDHFVLEEPGRWAFAVAPGRYSLAAFEDRSRDLLYQPGEPYAAAGFDAPLECGPGERVASVALEVPARAKQPFGRALDIVALQRRSAADQAQRSLGQLTVAGQVISLSDERFRPENAQAGFWRPVDFLVNSWAGVYFLEPYDARKVPVLFVHGVNGSPANFAYLIERLDRSRFQAWVYYYPSSLSLDALAAHLDQTLASLRLRYGFDQLAVVAHSMGGLVARSFIQRHAKGRVPLFVSIATPWGGHRAARAAVNGLPVVADAWRDLVPDSVFQRSLYEAPLPEGTEHHLLFTYNDGVVTAESQLLMQVQKAAARLYGFNDTHNGVLGNSQVSQLLNELLASSF